MLFLHEVHKVLGTKEDRFEAAFREGWMPLLAKGDDARLLWYANHAHGTGPSYQVTTITGVRDGAAWERLAHDIARGELRDWMRELDGLRHDVTGKILLPVYWSPLQDVAFEDVPTDGREHEPALFMEDTGWPSSTLDDYIKMWDEIYYRPMQRARAEMRVLDIQVCWQVAHGAGLRPEAILWQKITNRDALIRLLTTEIPPEHRGPGTYMHDALAYRDQWRSKLLRTSVWSPLS